MAIAGPSSRAADSDRVGESRFPNFHMRIIYASGKYTEQRFLDPPKAGDQEPPGASARASGRSSNFLISDAVESYVADQERLLAEMRQADRQVRGGHYIRHEDMKAWLLSWGTKKELPPPKCACGKDHPDEPPCR